MEDGTYIALDYMNQIYGLNYSINEFRESIPTVLEENLNSLIRLSVGVITGAKKLFDFYMSAIKYRITDFLC